MTRACFDIGHCKPPCCRIKTRPQEEKFQHMQEIIRRANRVTIPFKTAHSKFRPLEGSVNSIHSRRAPAEGSTLLPVRSPHDLGRLLLFWKPELQKCLTIKVPITLQTSYYCCCRSAMSRRSDMMVMQHVQPAYSRRCLLLPAYAPPPTHHFETTEQ